MNNIKIVSSGKYLPKNILTNFDLEQMVDTSDEWIVSRTGIKSRYIAKEETNSDLAYLAAKNAIDKANYDKNKIELIIVATFTSEYKSPSVASLVQAKLGLNQIDIACFDINAACTGFIYALHVATQMINSGSYNNALVIGSEVISSVINYRDRNTCVLFGDGAGALIIEKTDLEKPAYFYTSSEGDLENRIIVRDYIEMEGQKVYQFATKIIPTSILKVLEKANLSIEDIDMVIPHQANIRIIEKAASFLEVSMNKFYVNIKNYGNTSAASVAIAFDEYIESLENPDGKKIIFVGFGAGLSWGAALLTL